MAEFLMKPKIDFAFKEIMEDEKARTGFLSAVLKIRPEDIRETHILNTYLRREHEDDKQGILDVRLLMDDGSEIDTEIQLSELAVWGDRSLFYLAKMLTGQLGPGDSYRKLKKCIGISILDFVLFKDVPAAQGDAGFYSCFHIREDTRSFLYTDKMEFHVIELPKLPEGFREGCSSLERWARFINAERKEEFDMIAQKDPYIDSAYEKLQIISQDKEKRMEYEAREKAIRDYNEMMLTAIERTRKETKEETKREYAFLTARRLLSMGYPMGDIMAITSLTEKEIESTYEKQPLISQGLDKRMEYEAREKAIRGRNEEILTAIERTQKETAPKKALDIAMAMATTGKYALEEISALCGLPLEEVRLLLANKTV